MDEHSVWTESLTARQSRTVARALRAAGYSTATIAKCTGYIITLARYFEPGDTKAREAVLDIICQAAGIQPQKARP